MICRFASTKYELIPGNIKSIKNTNIAYVRPHILKVKGNDYLIFEKSDMVFINEYENLSFTLDDFEDKQTIDLYSNSSNLLSLLSNWIVLSRKEKQKLFMSCFTLFKSIF